MHGIITGEDAFSDDIKEKKNEVLLLDENMRLAHAQRVAKKKCDEKLTITYNNIIDEID